MLKKSLTQSLDLWRTSGNGGMTRLFTGQTPSATCWTV